MKVAKDNGSKRCVGFPEGTCNVILDAEFIEGYSKKQSGPSRVKEEKGWGVKVEKWSDETDEEYSERKEKEKGKEEQRMKKTRESAGYGSCLASLVWRSSFTRSSYANTDHLQLLSEVEYDHGYSRTRRR